MPAPEPAGTASSQHSTHPAGLTVTRSGAAQLLTLERPQARNALDRATTAALTAAVPRIARDPDTYAVVLRSGRPGMFCAGGDVRELAALAAGDPLAARAALAAEYSLVWLFECFSKPVVSLIDGAVMGAGAGLTLGNTHRVAGEHFSFAMPEVRLGLFPDDGVAWTLGRLPGAIGEYLALTGRRLGRADAFALGLVSHCIDAAHFASIEAALCDAQPVDPLLDGLHRSPGTAEIEAIRPLVDAAFSAPTVEAIVARLEAASGPAAVWSRAVLADIAAAAPLSLKVALRHVRQARALDRRQTLSIDYRLAARMIAASDFREGVRALLIDRDGQPAWRPASLGDITTARLDALFHAAPDTALHLRTRQEMQAARV